MEEGKDKRCPELLWKRYVPKGEVDVLHIMPLLWERRMTYRVHCQSSLCVYLNRIRGFMKVTVQLS